MEQLNKEDVLRLINEHETRIKEAIKQWEKEKVRLIDADKVLQKIWKVETKDMFHMTETVDVVSAIDIEEAPTVNAIPVEWLENFTNDYCDLASAIDTQFFINEFILKRWRAESEGKDWPQVKNNAEKNYQYIKKLLREGKTLEAAKFVEEKENE